MATDYATSSYKTALMHNNNGTWEKLVDIKTTPDLGQDPDRLEITHLSDRGHRYIDDIDNDGEGFDFTANYTLDDYQKLLELKGSLEEYAVWYDDGTIPEDEYKPEGALGKWSWTGQLKVYANGVEVSSIREMTITISCYTTPVFSV